MELELRRGGLSARVDTLGAELVSCRREGGPEYIWTGDPAYWAGRNPLLFPVVGNLRDGKVRIGGREYAMARHGFARRREFVLEDRGEDWVRLVLAADPDTLAMYPFPFRLTVEQRLEDGGFSTAVTAVNTGRAPMPFCLGCHTAYNWPLLPGDDPQDYSLRFEKEEELESFNPFGWRQPFVQGRERPLSHALFTNYTRSVTGLRSTWLEFGSRKHGRRVRIRRGSFSYLAMWTPHDHEAPLLCLEPCTGLQPGNHGCLRLEDRDGCITLSPGEAWEGGFWLSFS